MFECLTNTTTEQPMVATTAATTASNPGTTVKQPDHFRPTPPKRTLPKITIAATSKPGDDDGVTHHRWRILDDGVAVGVFTFETAENGLGGESVWVLDIKIYEKQRCKGFAKATLYQWFDSLPADCIIFPGCFTEDGEKYLRPIFARDKRCNFEL